MEENIITLPDGRKYKLVPVEEEQKKDDVFDVVENDTYFYRSFYNVAMKNRHDGLMMDMRLIDKCNACKDENYIKINCLETELHDRLRKYSYQHGWDNTLWNKDVPKHGIAYNTEDGEFRPTWTRFSNTIGAVHFASKSIACDAITDVVLPFCEEHPEYMDYLKGENV